MTKQVYLCLVALLFTLASCNMSGKSSANDTDSVAVRQTESAQAEFNAKATKLIMELYNTVVLDPVYDISQSVENMCTEKLQRKLAAAYDYDGEGYAVWEFRSGLQDGDGESRVNHIKPLGDGWYEVDYTDMGWHGTKKIKVISQNGKMLIDDYE